MSNYEIEDKLKEYGGVADKDIERTCGNCFYYDAENWICNHESNDDSDDWCLKDDAGCWHHMTHDEQKRLKDLIDERCKQDEKRRIAEERENGTGQCAGCPFREMRDMLGKIYDIINRGIKLVIAIRVKKGCTPATARLLAYSNIEIARKIKALLKKTR